MVDTNDYFDHVNSSARLTKGTKARADAVNSILDSATAGFDKFPDEADFNQSTHNFGTDTGAADAYDVADLAHITGASYVDGQTVEFEVVSANTGAAPTLDVSTTTAGTAAIVFPDDSALAAGDMATGAFVTLKYSSTLSKWMLVSGGIGGAAAASAAAAAVSAAAAAASAANLIAYVAVASSATPDFDMNDEQTQTVLAVDQNIAPTLSNMAAGRSVTVILEADGAGPHTVTYNASWNQLGTLPTSIASNKALMLSFVSTTGAAGGIYVTGVGEI